MKSDRMTEQNGHQSPRAVLNRVVGVLTDAGFYAYLHIDDQNRWTVSVDAEDGHLDVRLGGGVLILEAWDTSPGLFWEEENERRFHALERRARIVVPAIARGIVEEGQEIWWDEHEHGVGARVSEAVDFDQTDQLPHRALSQLERVNRLLADVERRLLD